MHPLRISASIRNHRTTKNITQAEFGALLGVSGQAVSKWEREICCPDITLLSRLSEVLGVSVEYLLGLETS